MPRPKIADGFKAGAEKQPSGKERAIGAAIGSGISNLVTGTAAAPFLFADEGRRFKPKAFKAAPLKHLKRVYGASALGKGMALASVSMLGGAIREGVQATFEERKKTANGDMMAYYQELARRAKAGDPKAKASLERRKEVEARRSKTAGVLSTIAGAGRRMAVRGGVMQIEAQGARGARAAAKRVTGKGLSVVGRQVSKDPLVVPAVSAGVGATAGLATLARRKSRDPEDVVGLAATGSVAGGALNALVAKSDVDRLKPKSVEHFRRAVGKKNYLLGGAAADPFSIDQVAREMHKGHLEWRAAQKVPSVGRKALIGAGIGAAIGAAAGYRRAANKKEASVGASVSTGHSGDLLRVSKNVAAPIGLEEEPEILKRGRRKKATDGLAAMEVGNPGDSVRVDTSGPATGIDFQRRVAERPGPGHPRRRPDKDTKRIYSDFQVPKTAADGEMVFGEYRQSPEDPAGNTVSETTLGPVLTYSRKGSTEREQAEKARRKTAEEDAAESVVGPPTSEEARHKDPRRKGTAAERFARSRNITIRNPSGRQLLSEKAAGQFGIMVYQRDPGELPEAKRPETPKTRNTRMFGTKLHGGHAMHRRAKRTEDDWMKENGEFVEVGNRPGLREALRDVAGIEQDQVIPRGDVAKMVAERKQAKSSAVGRRKHQKSEKQHVHTHAPEDLVEVYRTLEMLLENPASKYFQVVG